MTCSSDEYKYNDNDGSARIRLLHAYSSTTTLLDSYAGYFELKFAINRAMRFMSKLKYFRGAGAGAGAGSSPAVDEASLERALITRTVRDTEAKVNGFLPAPGEYGLEVYANDPAVDGNTLYQVPLPPHIAYISTVLVVHRSSFAL